MKDTNRFLFLAFMLSIAALHPGAAQDLSNLKNNKPVSLSGSIGVSSSLYRVAGIQARQSPFTYGVNANATLSVYGFAMPFSFTWYNYEKSGRFRQPFNQFGISPSYKWLKVHLGYRNLTFSEFTLNGYTFLGAGVEANPGKFRFGAVYGKFNANSTYNLAVSDSLPKLTRKGWAVKLGYGTRKRFVDVSVLRIGDRLKNFDTTGYIPGRHKLEQNLVLGITSHFEITSKLVFAFDGSYSFYTKNRMAVTEADGGAFLKFAGHFMDVNGSSCYFKAFKTSLSYRFTQGIITSLEYRRIDPGFRSMGSYFFNNDLEQMTFNQSLSLFKSKLNLRGSLGLQRDNLNKVKERTSKRVIGAFSGSYRMSTKWSVDASFNNYSTSQRAYREVGTDSLRVYQVNRSISLMPKFVTANERISQMVMLNLNVSSLSDRNKHTANMTETTTYMAMLLYNMGLVKSRLNLSTSVNYIRMDNRNFNSRMIGGNLSVSKTFFKDKLSLSLNNNMMLNKMNNNQSLTVNALFNAVYRFLRKHSITLNINVINHKSHDEAANPSYNEIRGDIGYVCNF